MYIVRFMVFACLLCFSVASFALRGSTDTERKEEAANEYAYCMFLAKYTSVSGAISYVREQQAGSSLYSNSRKLAQENCIADALGLARYQDIDEIVAADDGINLVPVLEPSIVVSDGDNFAPTPVPFMVNNGVPRERHVSRPWTRDWLYEIAQYHTEISGGKKLYVASLVRSRVDQDGLSKVKKYYRRIKGKLRMIFSRRSFADCSSSAVCSTHLTGAAIDISLRGVSRKERKLLAERLLKDRDAGRILVIYEKKGNHFHVFVFPKQYVFLTEEIMEQRNIITVDLTPASSVPEVPSQPPAE